MVHPGRARVHPDGPAAADPMVLLLAPRRLAGRSVDLVERGELGA